MQSYTFLLPQNLADLNTPHSRLEIQQDSGLFWLYGDNLFYLKGFESGSHSFVCTVKKNTKQTKFSNCKESKVIRFTSILDFSSFFDYKKPNFPASNLDLENIKSIEEIFGNHQTTKNEPFLHFPPMVAKINAPKPMKSISFHKSGVRKNYSRSDRRSNIWCISFDSPLPKVPSIPEDIDQEAYASLRLLFDQRPAWTKLGIMNSIKSLDLSKFKKTLPYVAYTFLNGPWRNVWIKYDSDPRLNSSFKDFQIIEFRNIYNIDTSKRNRKWDKSFKTKIFPKRITNMNLSSHIFDGESLTNNFYQYQICDIIYKPVLNFLDSLKYNLRTLSDEIDGWYPESSTSTIRDIIKSQMEILIKSAPNPLTDELFDVGLISNDPLISENISEDEEYDLWDL